MTEQKSAAPGGGPHPSVMQALRGIPGPIWLVLVGMLVNRLGNFLQIFLILYLTAKGFSATEAGLALGAYGAGSVVGVLVGGSASDRIGYAWTIAGSMALAGLGTLLLPHFDILPPIIAVSALIGLLAQMYRPASAALLVERTPEDHHVMVFAVYRMAFNLGTTVGPLLGALLISHSYQVIFYLEAGAQLVFAVFALTLARSGSLARSGGVSARPSADGRTPGESRSYTAVLRDTRYVLFLLALFLNAVVYIQHTSALPLQIKADGHSVGFYSALLSLNAVMVICLELLFTKYVQKLPGRIAVALGVGLVGVGMNLYVAGPSMAMYVVATIVWTSGEMIGTPTASAWPGRVAPGHLRGRYIAAAAFPMQIGYAIGPVLGVAVWQASSAAVWWLSGILTVGAVAAAWVGMRDPRAGEPAEQSPEATEPVGGAPATEHTP
ncbi:MFS transporter [Streptomyces sp. NPDC051561]|uniref:MFS transporter n=1 Tax=Streptomyces sp. NPDC051561 TaxID=3365658 RepID=UPI0037877C96